MVCRLGIWFVAELSQGLTRNLQGTVQIAGIAARCQIKNKCIAFGLNFSPCYYGIGVWIDDRLYNRLGAGFERFRG